MWVLVYERPGNGGEQRNVRQKCDAFEPGGRTAVRLLSAKDQHRESWHTQEHQPKEQVEYAVRKAVRRRDKACKGEHYNIANDN